MSATFILFGIILILSLFGVVRFGSRVSNCLLTLVSFLIVLGYFWGDIQTSFFSVNICFWGALILMLILFFDRASLRRMHIVFFLAFFSALVLKYDKSNLLFYSSTLYFLTSAFLFLAFLNQQKIFPSLLLIYTILYMSIDCVFCYFELGYVIIDFDKAFLTMLFLYALSRLFDFAQVKLTFKRSVGL